MTMHDLTAAYALDALDSAESREYEDHLATCEICREQLVELGSAAGALAFAVESPAPPEALRGRILERARAERPNVLPLRSRRTVAITAIAAVAAVAAIGLGIWSTSLSHSLDRERSARQSVERLLADPTMTRVRVSGTNPGTLFVGRDGKGTLVVSGLDQAPSGRTYEAWVIKDNKPVRAGTFAGGGTTAVIPLEQPVPSGSIVAVTLERKPGADSPHGAILLHSQSL